MIGATVAGRYVLERELGRGGMATVYLARDLGGGAPVALKLLHAELAELVGGARFAREVRITGALRHPHILPVLDSGQVDGVPYFTMPAVDGETLAQRLRRERPLPVALAVRVAAEVAEALDYAHRRGIVHRDVKPENVMLAPDADAPDGWRALVLDFGVARAADGAAAAAAATTGARRITEAGVSVGTVLYMSPEQGAGDAVDGRSDVYALGCVLHEMLVGRPPFAGVSARLIMARHVVDPPPPVRRARPAVGAALERVVARAMAKLPADRYATAAAFREALLDAAAAPDGGADGPGEVPNDAPGGGAAAAARDAAPAGALRRGWSAAAGALTSAVRALGRRFRHDAARPGPPPRRPDPPAS